MQLTPAFDTGDRYKVNATFGSRRKQGAGHQRRAVRRARSYSTAVGARARRRVTVVAASETPLATVAVGIAVRTGATRTRHSTADAVKQLLLGSDLHILSQCCDGAAAGVSFNETLQKLA